MSNISSDLANLRELLDALALRNGYSYLRDCPSAGWPQRGVYFFFDDDEPRDSVSGGLRIVRVGSHALRVNETTTLWSRLRAHRGSMRGRHVGGGNHRGSVFRKHVGRSLLRSRAVIGSVSTWDSKAADRSTRHDEREVEVAVSDYIRSLPFVVASINDVPGPSSARGIVERGAIALLSAAARHGVIRASDDWLGRLADRAAITESLLWNVNHVNEAGDSRFLSSLACAVEATTDATRPL